MTDPKRCRLYEPGYIYIPACSTNIKERFDRVRAELAKQAEPKEAANVKPIRRTK